MKIIKKPKKSPAGNWPYCVIIPGCGLVTAQLIELGLERLAGLGEVLFICIGVINVFSF
jgi:hypothetical protein